MFTGVTLQDGPTHATSATGQSESSWVTGGGSERRQYPSTPMSISFLIRDISEPGRGTPEPGDPPQELVEPLRRAGLRPDFWNEPPASIRQKLQTVSATPSREEEQHRLGPASARVAILYSRLSGGRDYGDLAYRYAAAAPIVGPNAILSIKDLQQHQLSPRFHESRSAQADAAGVSARQRDEGGAEADVPPGVHFFQVGTHLTLENALDEKTDQADLSMFENVAEDADIVLQDRPPMDHQPIWLKFVELFADGRFPITSAAKTIRDDDLPDAHLRLFVSHRWRSRDEPDPDNRDFELLYRKLAEAVIVAVLLAARRGLHVPRRVVPMMNNSPIGLSGDILAESVLVNVLRGLLEETDLYPAAAEAADACREIQALGGMERAELHAVADVLRGKVYLQLVFERIFLWYDYSCAPQDARDDYARAELNGILRNLRQYVSGSQCVVVLDDAAEFYSRAWCAFEAIASIGQERIVVGAAPRKRMFGKGFEAYPAHLRELAKRAVLDTEVFQVQDRYACMERLGLAATDSRDLDYLYNELTKLALEPFPFLFDDTEVVTGSYPVLHNGDEGRWLFPSQLWGSHLELERIGSWSLDLTAATIPRPVAPGASGRNSYWDYRPRDEASDGVGHLIIVAGSESEAVLWSDTADARVGDLENLFGVPFRSRCWLATDFAPVGRMPCGALETRTLEGRLWVVVSSSPRIAKCPLVRKVLQGPAFLRRGVFLLSIDHPVDNVIGCRTGIDSSGLEMFPIKEERSFRPVTHQGGLFRNVLASFI